MHTPVALIYDFDGTLSATFQLSAPTRTIFGGETIKCLLKTMRAAFCAICI